MILTRCSLLDRRHHTGPEAEATLTGQFSTENIPRPEETHGQPHWGHHDISDIRDLLI